MNGDAQPKACDIIRITGLPENCEAAKQALIDNIPITVEVSLLSTTLNSRLIVIGLTLLLLNRDGLQK